MAPALASMGRAVLPAIEKSLARGSPTERGHAARALPRIPGAEHLVVSLLANNDPVLGEVLSGMWNVPPPEGAAEALARLIGGDDPQIRDSAVHALGGGSPRTTAALVDALAALPRSDRAAHLDALDGATLEGLLARNLGDESAIQVMEELRSTSQYSLTVVPILQELARRGSSRVRSAARANLQSHAPWL